MNKDELLYLLERIADRTASEKEIAQYNSWCDGFRKQDVDIPDMEAIKSGMLSHIHQHMHSGAKIRRMPVWRYIGVAAAVTAITLSIWIYTSRHPDAGQDPALARYTNDIPPGGNNATLTVGNGSPMQLSQAQNTVVVSNEIKYSDGSALGPLSASGGEIPNITATTQRGGMYAIILPDNTKVWLNNASRLVFPAKFGKIDQRIVKLIGEAYFEVAKDAKRPFVVQSAGQNVTVLGTHFNISAYEGEGIRTTLLEGSVKVASILSPPRGEMSAGQRGEERILRPNQQSLITGTTGITVKQVDPAEAIAWKNGYFRFYDVDLETFMTTIARWYNIEVSYQGGISQYKDLAFGGSVSRAKNISEVLKILEQTGKVHYKIEGRKVTITK